MPPYELTFARSARKELQALPQPLAKRVLDKIETLVQNPKPPGSQKLHGHSNLYRIRVGDYRVIYSVDDANQIVDISVVRHRNAAYR